MNKGDLVHYQGLFNYIFAFIIYEKAKEEMYYEF